MTESEIFTVVRLIGFFIAIFILWWTYKFYKYSQSIDNSSHSRYHHSSLDSDNNEDNNYHEYGNFDCNGVDIHKTSRLNPGFFGKNTIPPAAKDLPNVPSVHLPLTIYPQIGHHLTGKEISNLVSSFGLERRENGTYVLMRGHDHILMTMLNLKKPGTFPDSLDEMGETKGIMLVLQLPYEQDAVKDYETFYAVANEMAIACGGRLCTHEGINMQAKERHQYLIAAQQFQTEYDNWLAIHQQSKRR